MPVGRLLTRLPVIFKREGSSDADENNDQLERELAEQSSMSADMPMKP
jgi:hypothetical protein